MNDNTVRMVLFPRYTSIYGVVPMYSAPFSVRRFAKVLLTAWEGKGLGTSAPDVWVTLEQSADLGTWRTAGNVSCQSEQETTIPFDLLDLEWARVKVAFDPPPQEAQGQTFWAVGTFVLREGERA